MTIEENDALRIFQGIDTLPEDMRPRAASLLDDYRKQQEDAGLPLWPTQEAATAEKRKRLQSVFDNPLTLDDDDGSYVQADRVQPGLGDTLRKREASILWLADRYGADESDVRKRLDFYKADAAEKWGAGTLDDSAFFAKAKGEIEIQKTKAETLKSASSAAFDSALRGGSDMADFAAWQVENEHLPEAFGEARKVWAKTRADVEKELGPDGRAAASRAFRAMRSITGASQESDAWINEAKSDLINLRVRSPKAYKLALAAVQLMAADSGKVEKGVAQGMGESAGRVISDIGSSFLFARPIVEMSQDASEAMVKAGITNAENPEQLAAQIRARREVENDIRDISRGVIDPVKSEREGWTGWAESAAYMGATSLPYMVSVMIPGGTSAAAGTFTSDSYNEFRSNGWEGADAAAVAVTSGVLHAAVERASEAIIKIPGVAGVLNKFGVKPGSSWVTQFLLRSGMRAGVEVGEEVIQEAMTPLLQELAHEINASIPDTPEGKHLSDVMGGFFEADNFAPLLLSVLPLGMIGAGMSTSRDMDVMEDVRHFFGDKVAADIMAEPDTAKRDAMIQEKFKAMPADEFTKKARSRMEKTAAGAAEASRALASAEDQFLIPRVRRDAQGWTVQDQESGVTVRVDSRQEAEKLAFSKLDDNAREEAQAMARVLEAYASGGDVLELNLGRAMGLSETGESEAAMKEAATTEAMLNGMTRAQAEKITWVVLGSNRLETVEGVRRAVSRLFAGAGVMDAIEEPVEAKFQAGLEQGIFTSEEAVNFVKIAAEIMNAPELVTAAEGSARGLIEAVSDIVMADTFGQRKDGKKGVSGAVTAGLKARLRQRAEMNGTESKFAAFLAAFRRFFKQVFQRSRALLKARKEGKLSGDFDEFLDNLMNVDPQARHEAAAAQEAMEIAGAGNMPFSLGMASTDGAAQDAESTPGGLSEAEARTPMTIYRAGDADEVGVKPFSSWTPEKETAVEYQDNPGFGGETLRQVRVDAGNVLEADTTSRRGMRDLAEALGFESEIGDDWFDNGWRYPWEESSKVKRALEESEFDAVQYTDDFPEGATTIIFTREPPSINPEPSRAEGGSFSLAPVTPAQDAEYLAAVEAGDIEAAQSMVDKAAGRFASMEEQNPGGFSYGDEDDQFFYHVTTKDRLEAIVYDGEGLTPGRGGQFGGAAAQSNSRGRVFFTERSGVKVWLGQIEEQLENSRDYEEDQSAEDDLAVIRIPKHLVQERIDDDPANSPVKVGRDFFTTRAIPAFPDAVVRDESGQVIPLSQRFNEASPDIRFSLAPRSLAEVADTVLAVQMRRPAFREAFYDLARQKLAKLRQMVNMRPRASYVDQSAEIQAEIEAARVDYEADVAQLRQDRDFELSGARQEKSGKLTQEQIRRDFDGKIAQRQKEWIRQKAEMDAKISANDAAIDKDAARAEKDRQMAALRTLDAILSAFPQPIRDEVGGFYQLASKNSDKARETEIIRRLDRLDEVVEKEARKHYSAKLVKALNKAAPVGKPGEVKKSKLIVTVQDEVDSIAEMVGMDSDDVAESISRSEAAIISAQTPEAAESALTELNLLELFGGVLDLKRTSSQELEVASEYLEELISQGREARKMIDEARRERVKEMVNTAKSEAFKGDAGPETTQSAKSAAANKSGKSLLKKFFNELSGFDGVLRDVFGAGSKTATEFSERFTLNSNQYEDVQNERRKRLRDFARELYGTKLGAKINQKLIALERIQNDSGVTYLKGREVKAHKLTLDDAAKIVADPKAFGFTTKEAAEIEEEMNALLELKGRRNTFTFEQVAKEGDRVEIPLSQMDALYISMALRQPGILEQQQRYGYDQGTVDQLEKFLTDESKNWREWMQGEYDAEYQRANEVYMRMFNARMPNIMFYAPLLKNHQGQQAVLDPLNTGISSNSANPGSIKSRKARTSSLRIDSALSVFWSHFDQMEYWIANAEYLRDVQAVMLNPDVRQSVVSAHGEDGMATISAWVQLQMSRGVGKAALATAGNKMFRNVKSAISMKALALSYTTTLKTLPSVFYSLGEIHMSKWPAALVSGMKHWDRIWKTNIIQRRLDIGGMPELRDLGSSALPMSWVNQGIRYGSYPTMYADGVFTTYSAAMAYGTSFDEAKRQGAGDEVAHKYAEERTALIVSKTAQPENWTQKSLFENDVSGAGGLFVMFMSDPRQKMALTGEALNQWRKGGSTTEEAMRKLLAYWIIPGVMFQLANAIGRSLFKGDDDEWEVVDFATAALVGQLQGFVLLGSAAEMIFSAAIAAAAEKITGEEVKKKPFWNSPKNPLDQAAQELVKSVEKITKEEGEEGLGKAWQIFKSAGMLLAPLSPAGAIPSTAERVMKDTTNLFYDADK